MNAKKIIGKKMLSDFRVSKYTLTLNFEAKLNIVICDYCYLKLDDELISSWHYDKTSKNLEEFIKLIEIPVKDVFFSEEKGMTIDFGEYKLIIPKPNDDYEYLHVMSDTEGVYIY